MILLLLPLLIISKLGLAYSNCVNINNPFDNDLVIFMEQEELFDRQFDDFDTVFVDIINDFNSYNSNVSNNNLHNTANWQHHCHRNSNHPLPPLLYLHIPHHTET